MLAAASSSASKRTLVDSDSDGEYQENVAPPKKRAAPQKRAAAPAKVASIFETPGNKRAEEEPHTEFTLALKTHDDLVKLVLAQQTELLSMKTAVTEQKQAADRSKAEQVVRQVALQRQMMYKAISASMGWKPRSRQVVLRPPVTFEAFKIIFGLDAKFKEVGKLTVEEFATACGGSTPSHSVRYDTLGVTGDTVNVRYSPEAGSGTVSGTYGCGGRW